MHDSTRRQQLPSSHIDVQVPVDKSVVTLLRADTLIPGRGEPIRDGAIAVRGSTIEWVGSFPERPTEYHDMQPTHVCVLMPGLWDCHTHFMGVDVATSMSNLMNFLPNYSALIGAITVDDLRRTLMAGYTSVRELEGYAGDLWPAVRDGPLVGPNIYSSIAALSITGGHCDDHLQPIATIRDAMEHGGVPLGVCDGVDECIKTVRRMVRRGARVIKVCSSGGVLSLDNDPEDRQFSDEELKAMVDEAARSRRAVAAHAIGKAGIMAALRAGVKSIEHGTYIDEEVADLMIEKDAIFVPTQHVVRTLATDYMDQLPPSIKSKVLRLDVQSREAYKLSVRKGVKIALGTDVMSSDKSSKLSHGNNAHELVYAVEAGMTPLQAIECATANGPETLGGLAPLSGQLKEGYDADIIAVKANPLEDIKVLTNPDNVTHVWRAGSPFKSLPASIREE
ncbi:hypothetical protein JDV02_007787 [Purpureocillium takamizusanense]|uniref:Amidohydrolase-related domain-containing protein n=1 Tax=Purpureocillium takamizusanense TaxID=2060973 RepID=A0A9Q8QIX4_9HYPO|nr:uncharacterized protein JDV02_007787 [Purpureocillium takamizusanense]UNI21834.1 hypothetical protein JDV02_007787 [Purpureocillium takamizusanense]